MLVVLLLLPLSLIVEKSCWFSVDRILEKFAYSHDSKFHQGSWGLFSRVLKTLKYSIEYLRIPATTNANKDRDCFVSCQFTRQQPNAIMQLWKYARRERRLCCCCVHICMAPYEIHTVLVVLVCGMVEGTEGTLVALVFLKNIGVVSETLLLKNKQFGMYHSTRSY